jgi:hypothetical protein
LSKRASTVASGAPMRTRTVAGSPSPNTFTACVGVMLAPTAWATPGAVSEGPCAPANRSEPSSPSRPCTECRPQHLRLTDGQLDHRPEPVLARIGGTRDLSGARFETGGARCRAPELFVAWRSVVAVFPAARALTLARQRVHEPRLRVGRRDVPRGIPEPLVASPVCQPDADKRLQARGRDST